MSFRVTKYLDFLFLTATDEASVHSDDLGQHSLQELEALQKQLASQVIETRASILRAAREATETEVELPTAEYESAFETDILAKPPRPVRHAFYCYYSKVCFHLFIYSIYLS